MERGRSGRLPRGYDAIAPSAAPFWRPSRSALSKHPRELYLHSRRRSVIEQDEDIDMATAFTRHADDGLAQATDPDVSNGTRTMGVASQAWDAWCRRGRRDCALATMLTLVDDSHPYVVESLALNPSAPRGVLEALASHCRESVRTLVARRLRYLAQFA